MAFAVRYRLADVDPKDLAEPSAPEMPFLEIGGFDALESAVRRAAAMFHDGVHEVVAILDTCGRPYLEGDALTDAITRVLAEGR